MTPTDDCDGCTEKPSVDYDVRATPEYAEAMAHPDSAALLRTMAELADLGRRYILPRLE